MRHTWGIMTTLAGRYRLIERLGAGGMSVVWRAYDEVLGRQVAVKVLAGDFATAPAFRDRIRREAQAVARLSHPGITNVFDYGEAVGEDGVTVPFVVMELVDGVSLADRLAQGPLPWRSALDIAGQVADALATAHARGLVHRDVTPGNVMLTDSGVKVVDFGISAIEGEHEGSQLLGTPAYLSPERLAGAPARPAADVYCLGVLLCQLLTGQTPVGGRLPVGVAGLPRDVPALVELCLAADPAARPEAAVLALRLRALSTAAAHHDRPRPSPAPATRAVPMPPSGPRGTRVLPPPPPQMIFVPMQAPPPRRRRTGLIAVLAILGVLILGCGAALATKDRKLGGTTDQAGLHPSAAHTPSASPTPVLKCTAGYKVNSDWKIGFLVTVSISIDGTRDAQDWKVEFDFAGNQRVDGVVPGKYVQDGQHVTITDSNWAPVLKAGKSYSTGLLGHYTGKNDTPSKITLNGVTCTMSAAGQ
jgi:serine/threonine-protein kinase